MSEETLSGAGLPNENVQGADTPETDEVTFSPDERNYWEEETSKKVDTIIFQKQRWRDKYQELEQQHKDAVSKLEELQAPSKKQEEAPKEKEASTKSDLQAELAMVKLQMKNPNLDDEDISRAMKYGDAEGVNPQEIINSDYFQSYLKTKTEKLAAENATPNPSGRSGSGAPNFDSMTPSDIAALSNEEYERYQGHLLESSGGSRSGLNIRPVNNI